MIYSSSRDYAREIQSRIKSGHWRFEPKGDRKHASLIHCSGIRVPVPFSPKDSGRGLLNFKSSLNKIERKN